MNSFQQVNVVLTSTLLCKITLPCSRSSTFSPPPMASTREIQTELPNLIRVYKDGTVERFFGSPIVPPSPSDPQTKVSSKDIVISNNPPIPIRLYLPKPTQSNIQQRNKLPIFVYFHGGGFCLVSAFSFLNHRYLNLIASESNVIAVSVEYRLAPEHPLPAAFEDCWASLKWVSSHSINNGETWLSDHGDFTRLYIGGDSAGGNIVHNMGVRCGVEDLPGGVKLLGGFLSCPFIWGSKPVGSEAEEGREQSLPALLWNLACPSAPAGIDDPMINPTAQGATGLGKLGFSKMLVCVCGEDEFRDRGVMYCEAVKRSGWEGEVDLLEVEGEDHCFHISNIETQNAKKILNRLFCFLT